MRKVFLSVICICVGLACSIELARGAAPKNKPQASDWQDPGPQVLEGCKKLDVDPPAYMTQYFIVQAPAKRINKAVGWVKHVEKDVYPTMVEILGYRPSPEIYAVVFQDEYPKHPAVYTGVGKFGKTDYVTQRIYVRCDKLDKMPPYQTGGGVAWESIHGMLNEPKRQAEWKPIWQTELLDLIFEMELYKRLNMQKDLEGLWHNGGIKDPNSRYAVLANFWKQYGWQPFQKFLLKLHENRDYKPTLDEGTFVYEMSLGAGKDVSAFFEGRGWKVSGEMKERIQRELKEMQEAAGKKKPQGAK